MLRDASWSDAPQHEALVPEVAHAGEHHGQACFVGGCDHLRVAHRPSGLDHGGGAGRDDHLQPVRERKERI